MAARAWRWLVAISVLGSGCVDLSRPGVRLMGADAAVADGPVVDAPVVDGAGVDGPVVDAAAGDATDAAPNPEDDPPGDAGPGDRAPADRSSADLPVADGKSADAPAAPDAPVATCTPIFRDDFESGTLDGWNTRYTVLPAVTGTGPIAGSRSLSTQLGTENAAGRTFAASSKVAIQFAVDLNAMTTTGSIPNLAAVRGSGLDYNPIAVYFGRDDRGPLISVRANLSSSTFERISFASLPAARVTVRIEWEAGGVARLFIDGAPFWTSPPLSNAGVRVDEVRVGNTGSTGSGTVLFDDVLAEECP